MQNVYGLELAELFAKKPIPDLESMFHVVRRKNMYMWCQK